MASQMRYNELREKMQVVKGFYTSRHYSHCAKYGQQLLTEARGEIHPLHIAYLNFYTALSHDTLAREATLKNRHKELRLAEKHYTAAITALTQSNDISSPTSPTSSSPNPTWRSHYSSNTSSFDSISSSTSSTPDLHHPELDLTSRGLGRYTFPRPPSPPLTSTRPTTPEEHQFAADTLSFIRMVHSHLESVRDLREKTNARAVKFVFPSPEPAWSPTSSFNSSSPSASSTPTSLTMGGKTRNCAAAPGDGDEAARESIRQRRKTVQFRPRFDPRGVRELCCEALAELC